MKLESLTYYDKTLDIGVDIDILTDDNDRNRIIIEKLNKGDLIR